MVSQTRLTVGVFDNVDLDNPLAARVTCATVLKLNPVAIIVTGRPATRDRSAAIDESDPGYSREVLVRNARRMKGLLRRMGANIPVFEGLIPPQTVVPHRVHIDEAILDLHGDFRHMRADGDFQDALRFLAQAQGVLDFVVGGPFTEVAAIMQHPQLAPRLGVLTCQAGRFGFGDVQVQTMAGGNITFNPAADPRATLTVLKNWPKSLYIVPTDIAKQKAVGVDTPGDLGQFGIRDEIASQWAIFYKEARLAERGERINLYDVHPVFLLAQLRRTVRPQLYTWESVRIDRVGPKGEIDVTFNAMRPGPGRYVVKTVDGKAFRKLLISAL